MSDDEVWKILYEHQFVYSRGARQAACLACNHIESHIPENQQALRYIQAEHQMGLIKEAQR